MGNDFRPIKVKTEWSSKECEEAESILCQLHERAELDIHQCLSLGDYILVKNPGYDINNDTIISYKKPRKNYIKEEFPNQYYTEIKNIQKKFHLTKDQVMKLRGELDKLENQNEDFEKQIDHLEKVGKEMMRKSLPQKILEKFNKNYSNFYECLNDDLLELEEDSKKEVKSSLKTINKVAEDYDNLL